MLIISCHADTSYDVHQCADQGDTYFGHLDNFAGVHAVMNAYFSGTLNVDYVRIELTYGEETNFEGAYEVLRRLRRHDVVLVVDVTGTATQKDFVIEKCRDESLRAWLKECLAEFSFDLYEECHDPIADEDEVDVYSKRITRVFFLGVPCFGGDYNEEMVSCRKESIACVSRAISTIVAAFPAYCERYGLSTS